MIPFQITFRDVPKSDDIWILIETRIEKLERLFDRISYCEVVVSAPHQRKSKGRIFRVSVHLRVPGQDIFVGREPEKNLAHSELQVAIHDTFEAVERKLEDYVRVRRGFTKRRPYPPKTANLSPFRRNRLKRALGLV